MLALGFFFITAAGILAAIYFGWSVPVTVIVTFLVTTLLSKFNER